MTYLPNLFAVKGDAMQPCRIRCYHYDRAFSVGFNSPQAQRYQADSVIIRIDFSDGTAGFGECAPRFYVTGENPRSVVHLIRQRFSPLLFESAVDDLAAVEELLSALERVCRENGILHYHSALAGIDLALVDALERSARMPPDDLFPTCYRSELRFCASIPFLSPVVIETFFPLLNAHVKIPVIKILMGEDSEANLSRVKLMRRLAGAGTELRLEFNGKTSVDRVSACLESLMPFGISAVEQPLPPRQEEGLYRLRKRFKLDFIADESLVSLEDAKRLARSGAYSIFNIKVSKCGGLLRSQRIAELANDHGILCQIGSHVGESPLLTRAGQRLARGLPNFDCYGGGSEILFSRLFEDTSRTVEIPRSSGTEAVVTAEDRCDLVSGCRLLMDCGPED